MAETMSVILTIGETFVASTGKIFKNGEIYTLDKAEAMKLLAVKGDYDTRFFKRHEGEAGVSAKPKDVKEMTSLPTQEEISQDMAADAAKQHAAAVALDRADAAATASRGTETAPPLAPEAEQETGEIDTSAPTAPVRAGRGRPAKSSGGGVAV